MTYKAYYKDTGKIIYEKEPSGNLFGKLPLGAMPIQSGSREDEWDGMTLRTQSGREIKVERE